MLTHTDLSCTVPYRALPCDVWQQPSPSAVAPSACQEPIIELHVGTKDYRSYLVCSTTYHWCTTFGKLRQMSHVRVFAQTDTKRSVWMGNFLALITAAKISTNIQSVRGVGAGNQKQ